MPSYKYRVRSKDKNPDWYYTVYADIGDKTAELMPENNSMEVANRVAYTYWRLFQEVYEKYGGGSVWFNVRQVYLVERTRNKSESHWEMIRVLQVGEEGHEAWKRRVRREGDKEL